jgi:drug/metabolite transporter (DMT)-like permease
MIFSLERVFLLCLFFGAAVVLPIYNKTLFKRFEWPLTATSMQVGAAALMLGTVLLLSEWLLRRRQRQRAQQQQQYDTLHWISWKRLVWLCVLPAVAFAGVMALSNVGVQKVSVDVHVLLKSGEAVTIVLATALIEREVPTWSGVLCCAIVTLGVVLLSVDAHFVIHASVEAILIHVAALVCGGVEVALMRRVWRQIAAAEATAAQLENEYRQPQEIMRQPLIDSSASSTTPKAIIAARWPLLLVRVALIKLTTAAVLIGIAAAIFEQPAAHSLAGVNETTAWLLAAGVAITATYQITNVAVPRYVAALTVAMMMQLKVAPQLMLSLLVSSGSSNIVSASAMGIAGIVCVLVGTIAFAVERYVRERQKQNALPTLN